METLNQAMSRLESRGFDETFRPRGDGLLVLSDGRTIAPEDLVIEETVRFEGESDPEDESVLLALRSRTGDVRGTFVATYGPQVGPEAAAVMERLRPALAEARSPRNA